MPVIFFYPTYFVRLYYYLHFASILLTQSLYSGFNCIYVLPLACLSKWISQAFIWSTLCILEFNPTKFVRLSFYLHFAPWLLTKLIFSGFHFISTLLLGYLRNQYCQSFIFSTFCPLFVDSTRFVSLSFYLQFAY